MSRYLSVCDNINNDILLSIMDKFILRDISRSNTCFESGSNECVVSMTVIIGPSVSWCGNTNIPFERLAYSAHSRNNAVVPS
jgi:hypothetical protein